MLRRIICVTILVLAAFALAVRAQDKPAVYLQDSLRRIRFEINPVDPLDFALETKLGQTGTYKLYEVQYPDEPDKMKGNDITAGHLTTPPSCSFRCTRVDLQLASALEFGKTYILKVTDLPAGGSPHTLVRFQVAASADILPAIDQSRLRRDVRVLSQLPVQVAPGLRQVDVERKTLELSKDSTVVKDVSKPMTATLVPNGSSSENDLTLRLDEKLNEGQSYNFAIRDDIVTTPPPAAGADPAAPPPPPVPLKTTGTVKIPGQPSAPDKPKVDFRISSDAAVDQKPQFNMVTSLTPLGDILLGRSDWYWVPKVSIDVGLGQTKSSNSVTLNFPFRRDFIYPTFDCPENPVAPCADRDRARAHMDNLVLQKGDLKTPTTYEWSQVPWYRLNNIRMFLSPLKLETDRKFQRINTLGNARFEFNFYKWLQTIKDKRTRLEADLQDKASLVELTSGFRLVPYLSFDFGGHVKNETVKNTKKNKSLVVPKHDIFRSYVGVQTLFQWKMFSFPMTLTIDEYLLYLAARETIGYVTDDGVALRTIRGVHHRGLASWDTYLDPGKHYSFNVTYENGRLAPNFEYLNKLSVGFRLVY